MKLTFPSAGFDDAVASVLDGIADENQMRALNEVLRTNGAARDEYLLRVELHSYLASSPDLFARENSRSFSIPPLRSAGDDVFGLFPSETKARHPKRRAAWVTAFAACFVFLAAWGWIELFNGARKIQPKTPNPAPLAKVADAPPKSGTPREAGFKQSPSSNTSLNLASSLLVHLDFENARATEGTIPNISRQAAFPSEASIIGCQWGAGRWPSKHAVEFGSVSDRVRLVIPEELQSVTLSTWVNVQGLDRQFNSLFMCDGFEPGEIHWQIRRNGALDLGIQGPTFEEAQVFVSPPVVGTEQFGMWIHLAVVIDDSAGQVTHYINGEPVSRHRLKLKAPFHAGNAELGNWNPTGFPKMFPSMIRHFRGAMDEFMMFGRPLTDAEINRLYQEGKP
jgi:hypothetical protein